MPATIKISDQEILSKAFDILKKEGIEGLNARGLCKELGCTARPIFRAFGSMEGLKESLLKPAKELYIESLNKPYKSQHPYLYLGMNYIEFAIKERNVFAFLFMTGQINVESPMELVSDKWEDVISEMALDLKLSKSDAQVVLLEMSILAHGMASLIIQNNIHYQTQEIENLFLIAFEGVCLALEKKQKENKE